MQKDDPAFSGGLSRRGFVRLASGTTLAICLPACVSKEEQALGFKPSLKTHTPFITPNDAFYLVAVDPAFRPALTMETVERQWSLAVKGVEGKTQHLSYSALLEKADRIVPYTFECIGNAVGGSLIGNAEWQVIPLKRLLREVGVSSDVKSVMFEGLDDFYSSVSIERAMDDYAFIAVKMNGAPLPSGHGFPARVILPDLYGMKQPRWLRRITLQTTEETTSYWETRGWAGEVPVKTFSRLDKLADVAAGKPKVITGVAFAGARGIDRVEISFDEGEHWLACQLETPPQAHVWSLWRYRWEQPVRGNRTIMVRAIDREGMVQTARRTRSYPDGASGYHTLDIAVT